MKMYIVDAFAESVFCGNPAGVVILPEGEDFPADEIMIKTAAELRYSETAFVRQVGEGEFRVRYFTPVSEVALCGHATIGAFSALLRGGYIADGQACVNHTLSGDLNISVNNGFVMMDMAAPENLGEITEAAALRELYGVMGLDFDLQRNKGLALMPGIVSTGLPDILLPVAQADDLAAIRPDFDALAKLSERYNVVGVHAFTMDAPFGMLCRVRNFAPLFGIDEEAATGTANGALTYYAYLNGLVNAGETNRIIQGESMGRPSAIMTRLDVNGSGCAVRVGGGAAVLAEGEIYI